MQAANLGYKLIRKIKDEKFDEENLHQYSLLIQLGARDFQACVVNEKNRVLLVEDYVFNDVGSVTQQVQIVKDLYDSHHLLMAGFWKSVTFSIKSNKFVQVPAQLFVESSAAEYLKFNAHIEEDKDQILFCQNAKLDSITVYVAPLPLYEWLASIYKNSSLKFIHQSTALIEGVLRISSKQKNSPLFLYVDRFKMHILAAQDGQLIYYNQFPIKHFADYVKYIMLVLTALGMDQQMSQVIMWGYIGKNSPHYHEFIKYIRNVSFGDRPDHLTFGYLFDELQEHHFFDLYSIHLLLE
ncbi:MAG TPA: DUF3822 family protein [Cyclobacteriaceae bacterium]|nr:DUF3822 family protein [Cyclobacteriaceae bacterium]